jgi:outer-membrane receptor for ferric coprogen and ferric-rhodotorulic acid
MRVRIFLTAVICGLGLTMQVWAAATDHFDIPPGDLLPALDSLSRASHLEFIYSADDLIGLQTAGVHGELTAAQALRKLLEGTSLAVIEYPDGSILIEANPAATEPGRPQVLRPATTDVPPTIQNANRPAEVVVTGTAFGLVATRTETPLREIPQTISLITSEQIRQQNDTDLGQALSHAPGITIVRTDSLDNDFYSRGFKVTSFHVDGGASLFSVSGIEQLDSVVGPGGPFLGTADLSEFDHIEVLRGADALFANNGNPGATVSMMRKRPLSSPQLLLDAHVGSWSDTRLEADATAPIALDGSLRGRVDMVYANQRNFYEPGGLERYRVFTVLDYDLSASTLVTVGSSYQRDDAVPFVSGLPLNPNGSDPHLPRKTALTFNWARYQLRSAEFYLQLRQHLGNEWQVAANASAWNNAVKYVYGIYDSPVDPLTSGFDAAPVFNATPHPNTQQELSTDITLTGTANLLGHREELAVGVDYTRVISHWDLDLYTPTFPLVSNAYAYDASLYADPNSHHPTLGFDIHAADRRAGVFSSIRLFLRQDLSVVAGARYSGNRTDVDTSGMSDTLSASVSTNFASSAVISPYAGVSYNLNGSFSLYASYADIYRSNGRGVDRSELKPSHGIDVEGGVKFAAHNGSLNGSLVLYRIRQLDVPVPDLSVRPQGVDLATNSSRGIESELEGHLQTDWLIAGGYTFNINHGADGTPLSSATPRHSFKLWTSKRLPGYLSRWTVGGELRAQSANSRSGAYCPDPTGFCSSLAEFRAEQRAYALAGLRTEFQIDSHWRAALSVDNVLDKVYYETVGTPLNRNWYGEPRSVLLRIDGRF